MKIDYHIHTNHSDGTHSVKEIASLIENNKIDYFSITDHDTLGAIAEVQKLSLKNSIFIPGIEFTCAEQTIAKLPFSFSIHLLGYELDFKNKELLLALENRSESVKNIFSALLKELSDCIQSPILLKNIPISCGIVMQLCDIHSYIRSKFPLHYEKIAPIIDSYATPLSQVNISTQKAIHLIHDTGGKAVWAHPFHIYRSFQKTEISFKEVEYILDELLKYELDGIEANYLDFSYSKRNTLTKLASKNNLISTGGSDFHGTSGRNSIGIEVPVFQNPFK